MSDLPAFAIDTNIFLYAHFSSYPQHERVRRFLEEELAKPKAFFLCWQVVYEYLRLTTHPRIHTVPISAKAALADFKPYLGHPYCQVLSETAEHENTLSEILMALPNAKGNFSHDLHYAALLKEHGVTSIVTADSDFLKFDFLKVINPTVT